MTKKTPANFPSQDQIEHLIEHIDQFVAITGAEEVEKYFLEHPEAKYAAICEVMDIDPLPSPAEIAALKAIEAEAAMTPREHRHAAIHSILCKEHGAMAHLVGQSKGGITASKIESLEQARERLMETIGHLDSAIAKYKADV